MCITLFVLWYLDVCTCRKCFCPQYCSITSEEKKSAAPDLKCRRSQLWSWSVKNNNTKTQEKCINLHSFSLFHNKCSLSASDNVWKPLVPRAIINFNLHHGLSTAAKSEYRRSSSWQKNQKKRAPAIGLVARIRGWWFLWLHHQSWMRPSGFQFNLQGMSAKLNRFMHKNTHVCMLLILCRTSNATSWFFLRAAQCLRQCFSATSKRLKWALMSPFSWTELILKYLRAPCGNINKLNSITAFFSVFRKNRHFPEKAGSPV